MILYTTLATLLAVALGLAYNVARAQVRGLSRELKKKSSLSLVSVLKVNRRNVIFSLLGAM